MLNYIKINNYILIKSFEGYLNPGFTTITGETGAGKSMILSAIDLACGKKINFDTQKIGKNPANITLSFDISKNEVLKKYLESKDITTDDSLIVRRVIHSDGKNNGYINNTVVPLKELAYVTSHLIEIHSQDSTRNILNQKNQIRAIDDFSDSSSLAIEIKFLSRRYYELKNKLSNIVEKEEERNAKNLLLEYKYNELKRLDVKEGEYKEIFERFKDYSNSKEYVDRCFEALEVINNEDSGIKNLMSLVYKNVSSLNINKDNVQSSVTMVNDINAIIGELASALESESDDYSIDEEEYHEMEKRLSDIDSFASKNNIESEDVYDYSLKIFEEYENIENDDFDVDAIKSEIKETKEKWYEMANMLSVKRKEFKESFVKKMEDILSNLKMPDSAILIDFEDVSHEVNEFGLEKPKMLIRTNIGQDYNDLANTLSGGEASRFSLALQSILKEKNKTIVFDEIDTGINGYTANAVGRYMLGIGKRSQVISITHIPQVAMYSDHHFVVKKNPKYSEKITNIVISEINEVDFIHELSRMMGHEIMDKTIKDSVKKMREERRREEC